MSLPGSLQKCSRASMRPWALPAEARRAMSNPLESWIEEQRSAYLYRVCADAEAGTARADLFTRLAGEAEAQGAIWRAQLTASGKPAPPPFGPDLRTRLGARLGAAFRPRGPGAGLAAVEGRGKAI